MELYENRVVAYIDILGWSELIKNSVQNEQLLVSIDSVASQIAEISQLIPEMNQVSKRLAEETPKQLVNKFPEIRTHSNELKNSDLRSSHFSDTLVLSAPTNKTSVGQLAVLAASGFQVS